MKTLIGVSNPQLRQIVFNQASLQKLASVSEVTWVEEDKPFSSEELRQQIGEYDAYITSWGSAKVTAEVLAEAKRLKFIGHAAGTVVPIMDPVVFDAGVTVTNANSCLSKSTAELTLAIMLAAAWQIPAFSMRLASGKWRSSGDMVMGLANQTVGLIGYGEISKEVARLLQPFHVRLLVHSKHCPPEEADKIGAELCELDELLSESQIISLHNTLTPATKGMLGREQLRLIRDGALLVNTARGPLIEESALIEELRTGRFYAAFDVFEQEPVPVGHPLLVMQNVLSVPHIGGLSRYWKTQVGETVADELIRWINGEPLREQITKERFFRLTAK